MLLMPWELPLATIIFPVPHQGFFIELLNGVKSGDFLFKDSCCVDEDRIMLECRVSAMRWLCLQLFCRSFPRKDRSWSYTLTCMWRTLSSFTVFPHLRAGYVSCADQCPGYRPQGGTDHTDKFSADSLAAVLERGEVDPLLKVPGWVRKPPAVDTGAERETAWSLLKMRRKRQRSRLITK